MTFATGVKMTSGDRSAIMAVEIARRRAALAQAEHSGEMEGVHITAATRADGEDYTIGRIDVDELIERGRARYGLN